MKSCFAILSLFGCLACGVCLPCGAADGPKPHISKKDLKAADKEFRNALDLQKAGKPEEALLAATRATQIIPANVEYITLAEVLRQQIVGNHLEQGNHLAAAGDTSGAMKEFSIALGIDPQN